MRVSLHTYDIPMSSYRTRKVSFSPFTSSLHTHPDHQIYQIYADRVKILLPSEEPIDLRSKRFVINDTEPSTNNDSDDDIIKCFDSDSAQCSSTNHATAPTTADPHPVNTARTPEHISHITLSLLSLTTLSSQTLTRPPQPNHQMNLD